MDYTDKDIKNLSKKIDKLAKKKDKVKGAKFLNAKAVNKAIVKNAGRITIDLSKFSSNHSRPSDYFTTAYEQEKRNLFLS